MSEPANPPQSRDDSNPGGASAGESGTGPIRSLVEFLALLCLTVLVFRTFVAEAYIVPTGSMAPQLLGSHQDIACPHCGLTFSVGLDDAGRAVRPVCVNCGWSDFTRALSIARSGDRLLVQKDLFKLREPRRWEAAVFQSPHEPGQAYVKRIIGLPNESIQIRDGDIWADGRLARKSIEEMRAVRALVFDNQCVPADSDRHPRWLSRRGPENRALASGWERREDVLVHRSAPGLDDEMDWLIYRHWDSTTDGYGPIRDGNAYNGGDAESANAVRDLFLDAEFAVAQDVRSIVIRIQNGDDRFRAAIPVNGQGAITVKRGEETIPVQNGRGTLVSSFSKTLKYQRVEAAIIDRRFVVAINGVPAFAPVDYDDPSDQRAEMIGGPLAIGALGGEVWVRNLRIYRDVYYTSQLSGAPVHARAADAPYSLGSDEYFMLGDNSPVSLDSRFWPEQPAVKREQLIGKPFLVHLPSQMIPLKVFGRATYWVPDPREIRYIR